MPCVHVNCYLLYGLSCSYTREDPSTLSYDGILQKKIELLSSINAWVDEGSRVSFS